MPDASPTCTPSSARSRPASTTGPRPGARHRARLHHIFPDAPLTITGPGEESGTYDFFVETVITPIALKRNKPELLDEHRQGVVHPARLPVVGQRPDHRRGRRRHRRTTTPPSAGSALPSSRRTSTSIKPVAVDGGKGCVAPSYDTISDGTYPISRPLFIYVNKAKAAEKPELAAFVDYYLTPTASSSTVLQTVPYVEPERRRVRRHAGRMGRPLTSHSRTTPGATRRPVSFIVRASSHPTSAVRRPTAHERQSGARHSPAGRPGAPSQGAAGVAGPGAGRARLHRHQRVHRAGAACSRRSSSCSRSTCRTCSASAGSRDVASSTS